MNRIYLCVFLGCTIGLIVGQCQNGWTVFEGSCYLFPQEKETFLGAFNHCSILQSHLVNIGSEKENAFLKGFVSAEKDNNHWIGLNDRYKEGVWQWMDSGLSATFTDWGHGEPGGGAAQNCVCLLFSESYKWHDADCKLSLPFICEKLQNGDQEIVG